MRAAVIVSSALLLLTVVNHLCCCAANRQSGANAADKPRYEWDEQGYVLYCPCMGRFGNQAAHFLGALSFAKKLNRTLAIPPWRSYIHHRNVPFTDWFHLEPVRSFHKSLPLEDFMEQLAPEKWPPGNRTGYCYKPSDFNKNPNVESCEMKYGNPFGPFWDEFNVEFDKSEFTRMAYAIEIEPIYKKWMERYPPTLHPVLAFKGAPASFPVKREDRQLQQYVRWNDRMNSEAEAYIKHTIGDSPYIGVHLRMGVDWERACEHTEGREHFMESGQCLEDMPGAKVTKDLCLPPIDLVAKHVMSLVRQHGTRSVFVASDVTPDVHNLQQRLGRRIQVYHMNPDLPELDLILLGKADYFIGNCISSFSAFVKRERDSNGKPSEFFAFDQLKSDYYNTKNTKTEL